MNLRISFLVLLLAATACNRTPETPPAAPAPKRAPTADVVSIAAPTLDIDGDNLLNLAYGAALVSRTGELNLESSAVQAIDGLSFSSWSSPPGGPAQTLIFAFGGPSRVQQLGVTTAVANQSPAKVRFAASADGTTWRDIITIEPADKGTTIKDVPPFEARYLRVETIEPVEYYAQLASVHAIGSELRPSERHSFGGCWSVNTFASTLIQNGARITGIIGGPGQPTHVDGGIEGRVAKLMWMRGPMWGYAAATLTPDGRSLSAITFHEEPAVNNVGQAWIGSRCETPTTTASPLTPADFLPRAGDWAVAGIIFDGKDQLIEAPSRDVLDAAAALIQAAPNERFRIVAQEFRDNSASANGRRTKARVDAVRAALSARGVDVARIDFVAKGSENQDLNMPSALQRALWSRIDLERR